MKREHHLKGTLRKQLNKHQNSNKITSCMSKTAVSRNFKSHQLGLAGP